MFISLNIGWNQIREVPTFIIGALQDPQHNINNTDETNSQKGSHAKKVSGIINDQNIKLVCSDETYAVALAVARPAVVNISCGSIEPTVSTPGMARFDDPSNDLSTIGGIGSGVVVHHKGYILTCYHIVAKASNVFVTPFGPEQRRYRAVIQEKDESLNLAILKITSSVDLPVIPIGDSSTMEVADWVLAVGSPFGLEQSATHGIISDDSRDLLINHRLYSNMFQTDVPINRGSSGGPLLNLKGELIGINMAIYTTTGVYNGVSFAMPINQAKPFLSKTIP